MMMIQFVMNELVKREWIESTQILESDLDKTIKQVYVWTYTSDNCIVLVQSSKGNWQFPGGKPESADSNALHTAVREMREETGLEISDQTEGLQFFGYYIITEKDTETGELDIFLQVRYLLKVEANSAELALNPQEPDDVENKIKQAKAVNLEEAFQLIPWLSKTDELVTFRKIAQI